MAAESSTVGGMTHFRVTGQFAATVGADTAEEAVQLTIAAVGDMVSQGAIRSVRTDHADFDADEIEYDPAEMAKVEAWLGSDGG